MMLKSTAIKATFYKQNKLINSYFNLNKWEVVKPMIERILVLGEDIQGNQTIYTFLCLCFIIFFMYVMKVPLSINHAWRLDKNYVCILIMGVSLGIYRYYVNRYYD